MFKNDRYLLFFMFFALFFFISTTGTVCAASNSTIYVSTHGNDTWDGQTAIWNGNSGPKATISNATATTATNGTIYVANGRYGECCISLFRNITIIGEGQDQTIIDASGKNTIFTIPPGVTATLINLTLTNGHYGAIWNYGKLNLINCTFDSNNAYEGAAIDNQPSGILNITNCVFSNNVASAYGAIIAMGPLTVKNTTFFNNSAYDGGAITVFSSNVSIIDSNFYNNSAFEGGAIYTDVNGPETNITANYNRFIGNKGYSTVEGNLNADNNWWGTNTPDFNQLIFGYVKSDSWLILSNLSANPIIIQKNGYSTITAHLLSYNGVSNTTNPITESVSIPITFTTSLGYLNTNYTTLENGIASTLFTSGYTGIANISATVDNQTTNILVLIDTPLSIVSVDPTNKTIINNTHETITIRFNKPILAGSSYNNISIKGPTGQPVPLVASINNDTLTLIPTKYCNNGIYTLNIPLNGVTDWLGYGLESVYTSQFTLDTKTPVVTANPRSGLFNNNQLINIMMNEAGTIYYTINGTKPTNNSLVYNKPLNISTSTTLKFFGIDLAGNKSPVNTQVYTIDKVVPKPVATTPINNTKNISLTSAITIKFNEKIMKGVNFSNIHIKNLTTGKITKTTIKITGNELTIKMTKSRLSLNKYEVYIPTNAVKDTKGNNNTKYVLNFKTGKY